MAGVYISYPFCHQKCSFCNFASDVSAAGTTQRYEAALRRQLRSYKWTWRPETLYLGGGTPSLMPAELLREVTDQVPRQALTEVTLEAAPGTLTHEKIRHFQSCGVNRISLGVQSFVAAELRQTGRRHTADSVADDVALLRECGLTNINIDLIAGLPEQTRGSWESSLDWVERLHLPHVSVYIFEVDDESRLGREMLLGGVRYGAARVPTDDLVAELYERAVERLGQMGIDRYEISNFARPGFESRHNLKYWQLERYAGFGLDAHSYDGKRRWSTADSMDTYLEDPLAQCGIAEAEHAEERFFVGLRLDQGIAPSTEEWERFAEPIDKWMRAGMLVREADRLRLTRAGVLLSNEVFADFVDSPVAHA